MYQNIYFDKRESMIHLWDDERGYLKFEYRNYAYKKSQYGKYKSIYGDSLEKTYHFNPYDPDLFEADLQPELRTLLDLYEDSDEISSGHRLIVFDIEVDTEGGFPNVDNADKKITAIALYEDKTKQYFSYILDEDNRITSYSKADVTITRYTTEKELLTDFLKKWKEISPTLITGWNSNGFDVPYIYNRIRNQLGKAAAYSLSPINVAYQNKFNGRMIIAGISSLDYMELYKKFRGIERSSYALGAVAAVEGLKFQKITYRGSLHNLYLEDLNKYIEYNLVDVRIVVELDSKFDYINLSRAVCHKGHIPYEWFQMSSRFIDGAILMYLHRNNLIAPNKPIVFGEERGDLATNTEDEEDGTKEGKFTGAFVKNPNPGLYDWVCSADITSLYPSAIMSLNISPETKIGKCLNWNKDDFDSGALSTVVIGELEYSRDDINRMLAGNTVAVAGNGVFYRQPNVYFIAKLEKKDNKYFVYTYPEKISCEKTVTKEMADSCTDYESTLEMSEDEFEEFLFNNKYDVIYNSYIVKFTGMGVVPTILDMWFKERMGYRALAKKFLNENNLEKSLFYDRRQLRQKIFLNSVYGTLGLPTFRFYDRDNAEATTLTGQAIIRKAEGLVNELANEAVKKNNVITDKTDHVIYIDTDSLYLSSLTFLPEKHSDDYDFLKAHTISTITFIANEINKMYREWIPQYFNINPCNNRIVIIPDVIAQKAFWAKKKRYAMLKVYDMEKKKDVSDGDKVGKIEVKGLDTVRSSFPKGFKVYLSGLLESLLRGKSKEEIYEDLLVFEENLDNLVIIDTAKTTTAKYVSAKGDKHYNPRGRKVFSYEKGTPIGVKSALAYNDLLTTWGLLDKVEKIHSGQKIKWVYLYQNKYNIDVLALKGDDTDPDEILQFLTETVDRKAMFDAELKTKIMTFFEVLRWDYPSRTTKMVESFFGSSESTLDW